MLSTDTNIAASILEDPSWRRAWSLAERLSPFRETANSAQTFDAELAAEILALWRASSPFDKGSYFADRLAMDGLTEEEFRRLLGTPAEILGGSGPAPAWVQILARAYSAPAISPDLAPAHWGDVASHPHAGFLNLVRPLMSDARRRLQARVDRIRQEHPAAPFDPARAVDAMFANLPASLLRMVAKTMVLELQVARLEGVLQGNTPAERFADFTERLSRPGLALKLLSEYPVLARRLVESAENWISFSAEFLQRLAADWNEIVRIFNFGPQCGALVEAAAGAGDTHRRGRSVLIARFEGGLQLVYKPRCIAVDEHFQEFIRWVNEKGANPQLR
ncbi:MAG TPA: DUF4135 domain-containing protein, partial [Candidatus Limnocylindrales bacterium]|nr:DUF4135 domain-containing protein [Candidatus Limnocylindrales bacterium]